MTYPNPIPSGASSLANADGALWIIRPYTEGDIPSIVALINAADAVDKLDRGTTEPDLRMRLESPHSDPHTQLIIAEGPHADGLRTHVPAGYGWVPHIDDGQ